MLLWTIPGHYAEVWRLHWATARYVQGGKKRGGKDIVIGFKKTSKALCLLVIRVCVSLFLIKLSIFINTIYEFSLFIHIPIVILSPNKPNLSPYYIKVVTNI